MTIEEFIVARIAEDEAAAKAAGDGFDLEWRADGTWWLEGVEHHVVGPREAAFGHEETAPHIVRHDPARVLRQCAAARAMAKSARLTLVDSYSPDAVLMADEVLFGLAAIWSDHPDYDPAWAPDKAGSKA